MTEATDLVGDETYRAIYGAPDGHWLIVEAPVGSISPASVTIGIPHLGTMELRSLGAACDVLTRLQIDVRAAGVLAAQRFLADRLGTAQQDVSRWVNGSHEPRLTSRQWSTLAALATNPATLNRAVTAWEGQR